MASRFIVLAALLVACQAGPVWFADNGFGSGRVLLIREGRAPDFSEPNFAYGFGSGLSYEIGGIKHSSGIGAAFKSGDGQAYGSGFGGSNDGQVFARGIGYANANPSPQPVYRTSYPFSYSPYNGLRRDYGNNYAAAVNRNQQNVGNYGTSIAQAQNSPYGSSATSVQQGGGFQSAVSTAGNPGGFSNAFSSAQSNDGRSINSAVAASHNAGGITASTAHTTQQQGAAVRQTGAFSFKGSGIQAAHSHVVDTY